MQFGGNMGAKAERSLVVLVDDDPEILHSLGRLLRRERFELLTTQSPAQVLEWARQRPVDLVIADQRMPDMSGTELLGRLRECSPATKGVILSGFPDTALIVERAGLRIERLIAKPWENDSLKSTVRDLLVPTDGAAAGRLVEIRVD
jgi:response regulator RpfG family c-di-GMP phosphodiesterase